MKVSATKIPYRSVGVFSHLINDYVESKGAAQSYCMYTPNIKGIKKAIEQRKNFPIDRALLVDVLQKQYTTLAKEVLVAQNIQLLLQENTFTVTTAHQPNIFTGPLYFFYKIIHAIQLAASLKKEFPDFNFVPTYYMGSEDADIEEVGSFYIGNVLHRWETKQTGAVGRMKVDDGLLQLLQNLEGYWSVQPMGKEIVEVLKNAYQKGITIGEATIRMVHTLFGQYGLVILQPDDARLKKQFIHVLEKELTTEFSHTAIQSTLESLSQYYHIQTEGRLLNLFYLKGDKRSRIEIENGLYKIIDEDQLQFTKAEMIHELHQYPDRFSPNVILRGVYQETILPGVVFIGGGGELAYWMELKNVFSEANVHFPVLQLRNSFLFVKKKQWDQWSGLGFDELDLFRPIQELQVEYVKRNAAQELSLQHSIEQLNTLYEQIRSEVTKVDPTLSEHTTNLKIQSSKKIVALEKKMVKAEKKRQSVSLERIERIQQLLFPSGNLQERVENFSEWVGLYGWNWVEMVLTHSNYLENSFTIVVVEE